LSGFWDRETEQGSPDVGFWAASLGCPAGRCVSMREAENFYAEFLNWDMAKRPGNWEFLD